MCTCRELPNAPKATQNALLQLVLDKKIGTYTLPAGTAIIAAGNRSIDRAAVHEMPTPVKNRFAHYEIEANIDDWVAWAMQNNISPTIVSFLRYRPTQLHNLDARENAFPTPRAWEMVNRKLPFMGGNTDEEFYGTASLIGDGPAGEFIAFKKSVDKMPDLDQIVQNPTYTQVLDDPSVLYASGFRIAR